MNNIDVSEIGVKGHTLYNTEQDEAVSRTSSQCERIIFPLTKQQEDQHILSLTESRTRKHRLFEPFQSEKKNKSSQPVPFEKNNQQIIKITPKPTFKLPRISEYYIAQKLQTTTHRVNNVMRMHSLIHAKDMAIIEEQKDQKKEKEKKDKKERKERKESVATPIQFKSIRQFKRKDSLKEKQMELPSSIFNRLQISQTMLIYIIIGVAVCGLTLNMLFF